MSGTACFGTRRSVSGAGLGVKLWCLLGDGVIPEAAELVKAGFVVCCDRFSGRFRRVWGVRHPQPGSRRSARSAARTNGLEAGEDGAILTLAGAGRGAVGVVCSCRVPSSWFAEDQFRRAEVWLPVIPSPLGRGMRRCGSSRMGSIKGATTPPGVGVMTPAITRPAGSNPAHAAPLASARISPSRRP